ncbi:hypothetical protein NKY66_10660 [Sinorhizobium meliloti]|uniref:hypothetical protein n=1 Tax=Rhizobium meliloti TaxID=382 RepID=UPI003D64BDD2
MVLKAVIGSVASVAALVALLSVVPADMSQLRYIDRCVTQQAMPIHRCYPLELTRADEQKSYEEALLLLFWSNRAGGAQFTSLETPIDDIDRRLVALPADDIAGEYELVSAAPNNSTGEVEVAGLLKWIIGIGLL